MKKSIFFCVALSLLAVLTIGCDKKKSGDAPVAKFVYADKGLEVTFTNQSTEATAYTWDFGDGTTATDKDAVHTYQKAGTYTVVLTAKNEFGSHQATATLSVKEGIEMTIDGQFTDWQKLINDNYAGLMICKNSPEEEYVYTGMDSIYYATDDEYLYFFLCYNDEDLAAGEIMSWGMYLDTDGNADTGEFPEYWNNVGGDFFVEFGDEKLANSYGVWAEMEEQIAAWQNWTSFQIWVYPENEWIDPLNNYREEDIVKGTFGAGKCCEGRIPLAYFVYPDHNMLSNITIVGARACNLTWDLAGSLPGESVTEGLQDAPALKFAE